MKNKINIAMFFVLLIAVLVCSSVAVIAYLSDEDGSVNTIKVGHNEAEILETFHPPTSIVPGQEITKNVVVKNTDGVPCYVRVQVVFSNEGILPYVTMDFNTTDWVYQEDGYYYYKSVLKEGETTVPLFTKVTVASDVSQELLMEIGYFKVFVNAETCQKGNAASYEEAWAFLERNK